MTKNDTSTAEYTPYGFTWQGLEVARLFEVRGVVHLQLKSEKHELELRVTPGGKMRLFSKAVKGRVRPWCEIDLEPLKRCQSE